MRGSHFLLAFFIQLISISLYSQIIDFDKIKYLHINKNYSYLNSYLESIDQKKISYNQVEEINFFKAVCSFELFNSDARFQLLNYQKLYPKGVFLNQVLLMLGDLSFREKNYKKSISFYNSVNPEKLSNEKKNLFNFRNGYALLIEKDLESSILSFNNLTDSDFKYIDLAKYYIAHIHYLQGNLTSSLSIFLSLENVNGIKDIAQYYISQIYFLQNNHDKLLSYALPLLENKNNKLYPEIVNLIAVTYFKLNDYEQTINYLNIYQNIPEVNFNRFNQFKMGFSYYSLKDYSKAKDIFEGILIKEDSLSQYVSYYLADCYLNNNQKNYALNSFNYSSKFDFFPDLKEDALFNYVKLVYEQENSYESSEKALKNYLSKYPNSQNSRLINNYLINNYSNSNNYSDALNSLDALSSMDYNQKISYQRMAYFRGIELFNSQEKESALNYFNKSLKYSISSKYSALSYYWMGESYYDLGQFNNAVKYFDKFIYSPGSFQLEEYDNIDYSLGYSHFQQQNYLEALKWFRKYVKKSNNSKKIYDSFLRIGDCYFMSRQYSKAIIFYQKAENFELIFEDDYAIYQKSLCNGLINENEKQKTSLVKLVEDFKSSAYLDDSKYDLAILFLNEGNMDEGFKLMKDIVNNHPFSPFLKKALLKLGVYHYSLSNSSESIINFKRVIEEFPGSIESTEALEGLKNVYIDIGDISSYFNYVKQLSGVSVNSLAKDSITYQAAEILYLRNDYNKAIQALKEYLNNFPNGIFRLSAHFYKAESLFNTNNFNKALQDYLVILEYKFNQYTEESLIKAADIEFNNKDYAISAFHYNQIIQQCQDKEVYLNSNIKLLNCLLELNDTLRAVEVAQTILKEDRISDEIKIKSKLIIGNYLFEKLEFSAAKKYFNWIFLKTNNHQGSEAKYKFANILFLENELDSCELQIFDLAENYLDDYFIAKGFILLSDVYLMKENLFQSKATLESIINNHEGDELVSLANKKLQYIHSLEDEKMKVKIESNIIIDLLNEIEIQYDEIIEDELIEDEISQKDFIENKILNENEN